MRKVESRQEGVLTIADYIEVTDQDVDNFRMEAAICMGGDNPVEPHPGWLYEGVETFESEADSRGRRERYEIEYHRDTHALQTRRGPVLTAAEQSIVAQFPSNSR